MSRYHDTPRDGTLSWHPPDVGSSTGIQWVGPSWHKSLGTAHGPSVGPMGSTLGTTYATWAIPPIPWVSGPLWRVQIWSYLGCCGAEIHYIRSEMSGFSMLPQPVAPVASTTGP